MQYSISNEIDAERRLLGQSISQWPPNKFELAVADQQKFVDALRAMEGDTRFMPNTREALETQTLTTSSCTRILFELEEHVCRLRFKKPFLAEHRQRRLALFKLNPSVRTLRAVWIQQEPTK